MEKNRLFAGREKIMKILIPLIFFGKGGGFRVLSNLASNWMNMGHVVDFITTTEDKPYFPTKANILLINKKGDITNTPSSYRHTLFRLLAIFHYIRKNKNKYDVILANFNQTLPLSFFAARKKLFYYVQAYEVEFWNNIGIHNKLCRLFAYISYKIPVIRIGNAEIYRKYKSLKCKYIVPPGLDLDLYYPKERVLWDKTTPLIVGCIGRKEPWKGSSDVANAVQILRNRGYNIHFRVAFNKVENVEHELVFPDGDKNLADYYRSLNILVAPGKIQLGAVHYPVIEAMACRTIVVNTGYYPSNDENSYIVAVSSPKDIADKIENIINDYEKALNKADKAFSELAESAWPVVSKKFIDIFNKELNFKS